MYKKRILIITVTAIVALVTGGCGSRTVINNETKKELETPEVTVSENTQETTTQKSEEENSNYELVDGYEKYKYYDDNYVYIPHIEDSHKVNGVVYLQDAIFDFEDTDIYSSINRPKGTSVVKSSGGVGQEKTALLDGELSKYDETIEYMKYTMAQMYIPKITDKNDKDNVVKHNIDKNFDIQAISFALYEDFYESIPDITMSVYGVSNEVWEKYLSGDDVYSDKAELDMREQFKNNNFAECSKLGSKDIHNSGVYYMNCGKYKEQYKQIYYVIELDDIPYEYAYTYTSNMFYSINDEAAYREWENSNTDKIIVR